MTVAAHPVAAENMHLLEAAVTSSSLIASRRLQASPLASAQQSYAVSNRLAECFREVAASCPDRDALGEAIPAAAKAFLRDGSLKKLFFMVEADRAVAHNAQPGLLSSLPPDVIERILRHVPDHPFPKGNRKKSITLARTSLACKATWAAYNGFAAHFKLVWRIPNFASLGDGAVFGPPEGEEGVRHFGRLWSLQLNPRDSKDPSGEEKRVSLFLRCKPAAGASNVKRVACFFKLSLKVGSEDSTEEAARSTRSSHSFELGSSTVCGYSGMLPRSDLLSALDESDDADVVAEAWVLARKMPS